MTAFGVQSWLSNPKFRGTPARNIVPRERIYPEAPEERRQMLDEAYAKGYKVGYKDGHDLGLSTGYKQGLEAAAKAEEERQKVGVGDVAFEPVRRLTMREILVEVSREYQIAISDILSNRRNKEVAIARQAVMYRCKTETPNSYPAIGRFLHKDHTSVLHGVRKHAARIAASQSLKAEGEG